MPPRQPLQLPPDVHLARAQVGERPAESQRLPLPEAARQPDRPPRGVPAALDRREHGAGLPGAQHRLPGLPGPRRLGEPAGVAGDIAALHLDLVRAGQDGVDLADRPGREPCAEHRGIAVLDVLGQQPVGLLAAPQREDMLAAQRLVAADRQRRAAALRQHHLEVTGQHLPHRPRPPGAARDPRVALAFQLAHPGADRLQRLALNVPPVWLAVSPGAHPDTRLVVTAGVRSLPDPRLAVAAPGAGHSPGSHSASCPRCASR